MGKKKHAGGRPTVMTDETLLKLEEGFMKGLSDRQACLYADIAESVLYNYQNAHPGYAERKHALKEHIKMRARLVLNEAIQGNDLETSKWLLSKRDKGFNPESKVEMSGALSLTDIFDRAASKANGNTGEMNDDNG